MEDLELTLKVYSEKSASEFPKIHVHHLGRISISALSCDVLSLKTRDKVSIGQNEQNSSEFYIFKDVNGFPLKCTKKRRLYFNCHKISVEFMRVFRFSKTMTFRINNRPKVIGGTPCYKIEII